MSGVLASTVDPKGAVRLARKVGRRAAPFAAEHDRDATFVTEGYEAARELDFGLLAVPRELGGGGHGLRAICRAQAALARRCASTALATAMHQHAVLGLAWRWNRGDADSEMMLRRIVEERLVLAISGSMTPAKVSVDATEGDGGVVLRGHRRLCSGSPAADLLLVAARLEGPRPRIVRAVVALASDGVEIRDDWDAMGMRGSGSNTVVLRDVFVPARDVLRRIESPGEVLIAPGSPAAPATDHAEKPLVLEGTRAGSGPFMPGLHISLAVIAAVYLGAATAAHDRAIRLLAEQRRGNDPITQRLVGQMMSEVRSGWWALEGMLRETTDDSLGTYKQMVTTMLGKRQVILNSIRATELAMEALGSQSYMRSEIFERTLRDVRAGITHPFTPEMTLSEVGRYRLEAARAGA